ncbi:MAG: type II secretion system protein GspN [Deltaproteobacteria bacterium]|nr:type II secretion system protein GspN [Deltaproteobacteria bacterium]
MIKRILLHTPLLLITLLGAFYLGLQLHFPTDVLQKRIQYEVQTTSKETLFLNIEKTSLRGIGISFSELQVLQKDKKSEEATEVFFTPNLHASVPFFSALSLTPQAYIETELFGGELHTNIEYGPKNNLKISPSLSNLNAALLPLYGNMWELAFLGSLDLKGTLKFPVNKFKKAKGNLLLTGKDLQLEEGKVLIKTLPAMKFTEAKIDLDFEKGKATVQEGIFSSPKLQIEISGHIKLNNSPLKSKLFLTLKIETGDEINTLIGGLGKPYQDDQGVYNIKVLGRLASPRIQSAKKKSRTKSRSKRNRKKDLELDDVDLDSMGDDIPRVQRPQIEDGERAKKRQERIERAKKRREERINKRKASKNGLDKVMPTPRMLPNLEIDENDEEEEDSEESSAESGQEEEAEEGEDEPSDE